LGWSGGKFDKARSEHKEHAYAPSLAVIAAVPVRQKPHRRTYARESGQQRTQKTNFKAQLFWKDVSSNKGDCIFLAEIRRRFSDPKVGLDNVAGALGLSRRYV
jgi:hypothetical protein